MDRGTTGAPLVIEAESNIALSWPKLVLLVTNVPKQKSMAKAQFRSRSFIV
jgi:hypothetical protein